MAVKMIRFYSDPVLREQSRELGKEELQDHQELYRDLIDTMVTVGGVGLAAVQIGYPVQVYAVDPRSQEEYRDRTPFIMINPKITKKENLQKTANPEGCLSIPGASCRVERYDTIEFEYTIPNGEVKTETVHGLFANIIQHELDHGEGKLYVDQLSNQSKDMVLKKFKKVKRHAIQHQKGEQMNGNKKFLSLVSKANQEALKPFIKETVREAMSEVKQDILQEIVKYTDRLTQATGIRMKTLENALVNNVTLDSEEALAALTMQTEDELLGLINKETNADTVEEGDYVRVKIKDPKGEMDDRNWSFTRVATTPYETGNEELEKSVLGLKVGESKEVKINHNNVMIPMNLEVVTIRTYKTEVSEEQDVQQG